MSNVLLEIKNLSKKYNNKEVVSRESFKLLEGDILGFIG
ncbi:TPA: ABC transporter ATP-binding protein, partial [Clostridioides difficile]|nr:ABC transporter ATP-binding protein [Clostridioides difficile]